MVHYKTLIENGTYFLRAFYLNASGENDGTEREALWPEYVMSTKVIFTQLKSRFSDGSLFSEKSACSFALLSGS